MTCYSTLRHHILEDEHGRCWYNAILNAYTYNQVYGLNMKWVIGGRIYNTPKGKLEGNGFIQDGTFTIRSPEDLKTNWDDTHAWLEDEEGLVYDVITEKDFYAVRRLDPEGYKYKMKPGFIVGDTYRSLKERGVEYVPFPMEHRQVVLEKLMEYQTEQKNPLVVALLQHAPLEIEVGRVW